MTFIQSHLGELAALATAVCWTLNSVVFESAGKRVGSLSVNYIRLFVAFFPLSIAAWLSRGLFFPIDADFRTWFWLLISGLLGFVVGDFFLFEAYVQIGARISLLIMSAAPPLTALIGFLLMGERISFLGILGMFLTVFGISLVILSRNPQEKTLKFNRPLKGIIYASLGALGQSLGLIFSKWGMGDFNVFAATQIRLTAALISFSIMITLRKKWPQLKSACRNKTALAEISLGGILGPFIGVTLSLYALKHTAAGIVSSLTSISPVIIIPASMFVFREKVTPKEVAGALISILGVIFLFL